MFGLGNPNNIMYVIIMSWRYYLLYGNTNECIDTFYYNRRQFIKSLLTQRMAFKGKQVDYSVYSPILLVIRAASKSSDLRIGVVHAVNSGSFERSLV